MANWCSTKIRFYGDKSSDLLSKIKEYTSENFKENGFGNSWLGNVMEGFGYNVDSEETPRCRGSITDICDESEDGFTIYTETAWVPMTKMWHKIIEDYYSDNEGNPLIYFDWIAEEFGCDVYCTNNINEFEDQKICIDSCFTVDGEERYLYEYYTTERDALEGINREFGKAFKSLEEAQECACDNGYDDFISIHILEEIDYDIE